MGFLMHTERGLHRACVAARRAAGDADGLACLFPEVAAPHVAAPLFMLQPKFDPALLFYSCGGLGDSSAEAPNTNRVGSSVVDMIQATVLRPGTRNAIYATSCAMHAGQWSVRDAAEKPWTNGYNVTIDGATAARAVDSWWGALVARRPPPRTSWVQGARHPCRDCCRGGQLPDRRRVRG